MPIEMFAVPRGTPQVDTLVGFVPFEQIVFDVFRRWHIEVERSTTQTRELIDTPFGLVVIGVLEYILTNHEVELVSRAKP